MEAVRRLDEAKLSVDDVRCGARRSTTSSCTLTGHEAERGRADEEVAA